MILGSLNTLGPALLAILGSIGLANIEDVHQRRRPGLFGQDNVTAFTRVGEYGDWSVACDNRAYCTAVSASREQEMRRRSGDPGDALRPVMHIARYADAGAPPHVLIDFRVDGQSHNLADLSLHVMLDADREAFGTGHSLTQVAAGIYALDRRVAQRFIDASHASDTAVIVRDGRIYGQISTAGMSAALRHADELQGRADSREAMVARGLRPPRGPGETGGSAIVARTGNTGSLPPEAARQLFLFICGSGVTQTSLSVQSYDLPDQMRLIGVDCGSGLADPETAWLTQRRGGLPEPLALPRPDIYPGEYEEAFLTNSHFDAASGILTTRFNNRNYSDPQRNQADCGWIRRWQWTSGGMEMIEARVMPACMGILPDSWMLTYFAVDRVR